MGSRMWRVALPFCAALFLPLVALAGNGTGERTAYTVSDQRVARLSVLSKAQLPQTSSWKPLPSRSAALPTTLKDCAPRSDFSRYTITGKAERSYVFGVSTQQRDGESIVGNTTVFKTSAMAEGDWKASSMNYKTIGCFLTKLAQAPGSRITLGRISRLPLHAGSRIVAVRAHLHIAATNGIRVPAAFDFAFFLLGRCQDLLMYGYVDIGNPALKKFVSDEALLLKELVYAGTSAGCLRPAATG